MNENPRAAWDEFVRITQLASEESDWPTGYIKKVCEFIGTAESVTQRGAVLSLQHALIWRHTVKKLPPSVQTELIEIMKSLEATASYVGDVYLVRGFLGDDSLVDSISGGQSVSGITDCRRCQILGWLATDPAKSLLEDLVRSEDRSISFEAALSLAMNGRHSGEDIIYGNYIPIWGSDGPSLEVAVALARLGNSEGIAFIFESCGNTIRDDLKQLESFIASAKRQINRFEERTDFDDEEWFSQYLGKLLRRIREEKAVE